MIRTDQVNLEGCMWNVYDGNNNNNDAIESTANDDDDDNDKNYAEIHSGEGICAPHKYQM